MLDRLNKLKENMAALELDGLVVTDRADVFYLSGLLSSNCLLLISQADDLLFNGQPLYSGGSSAPGGSLK